MEKQNAPGPKAEGVECLLGGDIDVYATEHQFVQHLTSRPRKPILSPRPDPEKLESALYAARNEWDLRRRRTGQPIGDRRIDKGTADRMLKIALAAMKGGGQ